MNDDHATFLKAIIARPDRDLPRLVYADWLEETATRDADCPYCALLTGQCARCRSNDHGPGSVRDVSNGHAERAEFIRVQCELARLNDDSVMCHHPNAKPGDWCSDSDCLKCGRAAALRRRERSLWGALSPRCWRMPGENFVFNSVPEFSTTAGTFRIRRGFVESIACSWSAFRAHADAIRKATPLRRVRLTTWSDDVMEELSAARFSGIEFELPRRAVVLTA
jgi:uncharacterized protein (TIGR02996 family)